METCIICIFSLFNGGGFAWRGRGDVGVGRREENEREQKASCSEGDLRSFSEPALVKKNSQCKDPIL